MAKKQNRKKTPHAGLAALIDDLQGRLNALGRMKSMSLLLLRDEPISRERLCAYRLEGHLQELRGIEVRLRAGIEVDLERMRLLKAEATGYWNEIAAGRARAKRASAAREASTEPNKRRSAEADQRARRFAKLWNDLRRDNPRWFDDAIGQHVQLRLGLDDGARKRLHERARKLGLIKPRR